MTKVGTMYGSEQHDPVVKYYDETLAITSPREAEWYLERAQRFGGPVLDLACGAGRLSLLLLRHGFQVTAIDYSLGMLNLFREKLEREAPDVRGRVKVLKGDMSGFDLGQKFKTIICCDAFYHNLTVEDEIACLQAVARHLTPQGRFLFNLPNPTCEFILAAARSEHRTFEGKQSYPRASVPGYITVERLEQGDFANQTIETTLRFTVYDGADNVLEQSLSSWKTRYLFRYEALHLLHRCGFEIESLVGDYEDGPPGEGGQLIFQVRLQTRNKEGML